MKERRSGTVDFVDERGRTRKRKIEFVIDVCQRCGVGAGKTRYGNEVFQHAQTAHRKGLNGVDLCDNCYEITGGSFVGKFRGYRHAQ